MPLQLVQETKILYKGEFLTIKFTWDDYWIFDHTNKEIDPKKLSLKVKDEIIDAIHLELWNKK